jgi:TonB family protein
MTKALRRTFPRLILALVLVCIVTSWPSLAGEADDAAAAFAKAAEQTDIRASGSSAFELDAKLNFIAGDGKPFAGSYKLVWISASQWREEIIFNGYKRIRIGGENRYWQQRSPDFELLQIHELADSLSFATRLQAVKSPGKLKSRMESGEALECSEANSPVTTEFCFDPTQGDMVLEKIQNGPQSAIIYPVSIQYSNFQAFGQRRFPSTIQIALAHSPLGDFSLEHLVAVDKPNPSDFVPPEGASLWLTCTPPEKQQMLSHVQPVYPQLEKAAHRQGVVLMYGLITPDGSVQNLRVLGTPSPAFADAAVAAVHQWRYQPLVCGGVATQLDTFIHVIFSIGN